ncbi:MAG: alpha/beta hydrolase [Deinococcota bacterium]|nr:alpha/beta hydrolase [Deinococcota bacterium]
MRQRAMKRGLRGLFVVLVALAGFGLGLLYPVLNRPALVLHQDAVVEGIAREDVSARYLEEAGGFISVEPRGLAAHTLFIFYPGGLVSPQAYEWLGVALAPSGVRTVIPRFTFDLAVTSPNRADALLSHLASRGEHYDRVVIGGHSLGGAMAARYLYRHPGRVDALVLMAAYSAEGDDLSGLELPVLVLAAEHDGRAPLATVEAGLRRLPPEAALYVVEGAVHSFFGRYGPQRGDGLPSATRHRAEADIREAVAAFILQVAIR